MTASFDAVVLAGDRNVVRGVGVAIASLGRARSARTRAILLGAGIGASDRADLQACAPDHLDLSIVEVADHAVAGARLPDHLPPAALFRLLLDDLLPAGLERVLYLDADVLIVDDPGSICPPAEGRVVSAARDAFRPWIGGPPPLPWQEVGAHPSSPYFNSGVMLVDLAAWKEAAIGPRSLGLLRTHRLPFADQCALNLVLDGDWSPLGPRWNLQNAYQEGDRYYGWVVDDAGEVDQALASPGIVHFTGLQKPWIEALDRPHHAAWIEVLDEATPWAGWRPPPPSRTGRVRSTVGALRRRFGAS